MSFLAISGLVLALSSGAQPAATDPAEKALARAASLLASGDAKGAEAAAREALAASALFSPQKEIAVAPAKNVLLEELLARARASYRARRARYFETLGRALARQERFLEARKSLRRAASLVPSAELLQAMAEHPDLALSERVRLLLSAFFAPRADSASVAKALLDTGAFHGRDDLQAVIDRMRFPRAPRPDLLPLDLQLSEPPRFQVATDFGTLVTAEALASGAVLVFYFPAAGCARCSQELEGVGRAVSDAVKKGRTVEAAVLVEESELAATRRVARLLAMRIQVGRGDRLPARDRAPGPGVRIAARGGYLSVFLPLESEPRSADIRHTLEAAFELLGHQDVPPEAASSERKSAGSESRVGERSELLALLDRSQRLEAGPLPLGEIGDRLDRLTGTALANPHSRDELFELLSRFALLGGAARAKAKVLTAIDSDYPRKILEAARQVDPQLTKEAAREDGVYRLAVGSREGGRVVLLQRSFSAGEGLRNFNFILKDDGDAGLGSVWAGEEKERPAGAELIAAGAVFHFERSDGLRGLRLVGPGGVLFEGAPAKILGGRPVEEAPGLVDALGSGETPTYVRRDDIPLEQGLKEFRVRNYRAALRFFEEASRSIDPESSYDEVDVRYNRARAHEELGEKKKALDLFSSIGDAPYQELVDQKTLALETAGRCN